MAMRGINNDDINSGFDQSLGAGKTIIANANCRARKTNVLNQLNVGNLFFDRQIAVDDSDAAGLSHCDRHR